MRLALLVDALAAYVQVQDPQHHAIYGFDLLAASPQPSGSQLTAQLTVRNTGGPSVINLGALTTWQGIIVDPSGRVLYATNAASARLMPGESQTLYLTSGLPISPDYDGQVLTLYVGAAEAIGSPWSLTTKPESYSATISELTATDQMRPQYLMHAGIQILAPIVSGSGGTGSGSGGSGTGGGSSGSSGGSTSGGSGGGGSGSSGGNSGGSVGQPVVSQTTSTGMSRGEIVALGIAGVLLVGGAVAVASGPRQG